MTDLGPIAAMLDVLNTKYETSYELGFLDPAVNACFRVRPTWAFGLMESDISGSPTRWRFPGQP